MAVVAVVAMAAGGIAQDPTDFADSPFLRIDPERIVLSDGNPRTPCGQCHVSEFETWQGTEHAQGFNTMHRSESARDILRQMNLRVTKRQEALCMRCHYTVGPELKAIAGVSCESCHGPARDWIDIHNDWGGSVDHPDRESPEHRAQRIARAEAGGMLRPSGDLYAVAANCFECHTIPVEELVNQGGHKSGTDEFNLPERMKEIRHNFVHRQWGADGGNREPTLERTRLMFVLGRILAYEYTLRGLAGATTADGSYYRSMHRRTVNARGRLEEVARAVEIPAVTTILELGQDAQLGAGQSASLVAVADRIREAGQAFARSDDHPDLQALDPLVEGRPVAAAPPPAGAAGQAAVGAQPTAGAAGGAVQPGPAAAGGTGTAAAAPAVPELPGSIRSRPAWMSAPKRQYLGDNGECMGCHVQAEEWWFENPHDGSHEKLTRMTDRRAAEISTLYGIGPSGAVRADQICMNCHGTILNAAIAQAVGCESCHGAAVDFLDPHQDGGNPQLGMNALKTAAGRAETCARCHHITDERLLAAGHPSGDHDPAQASASIKHWPDRRVDRRRGGAPYPDVAGPALAQAYQSAIAGRPVPRVTVATLPSRPASQRAPAAQGGDAAARPTSRAAGGSGSSLPPRPPQTPSVTQGRADVTLDLEPIPTAVDSLTTEDLLLLVKQRLERIHNALRGSR